MPTWPSSFPNCFVIDGNAPITPVSNSMALDVESGDLMTRRRFTGEMDKFSGTLPPVSRQTAIDILNFWRHDLSDGALPFTWDHPLSLESVELLMLEPPAIMRISGPDWRVTLKLQTKAQ